MSSPQVDLDLRVKKGDHWGIAIGEDRVELSFNYQLRSRISEFGPWFKSTLDILPPNDGDEIIAKFNLMGKR